MDLSEAASDPGKDSVIAHDSSLLSEPLGKNDKSVEKKAMCLENDFMRVQTRNSGMAKSIYLAFVTVKILKQQTTIKTPLFPITSL